MCPDVVIVSTLQPFSRGPCQLVLLCVPITPDTPGSVPNHWTDAEPNHARTPRPHDRSPARLNARTTLSPVAHRVQPLAPPHIALYRIHHYDAAGRQHQQADYLRDMQRRALERVDVRHAAVAHQQDCDTGEGYGEV